ncbi:MAG: putative quinol monooxygenase [Burkholderiales bacterium]
MIHVIATIELQPGVRDRFLAEVAGLVPAVRAEAGCIEYGAAVDAASGLGPQIALRPDVVTIIEKWETLDHLRAHAVAPHMQSYRGRVKEFVVRTTLQVLTPA